MLNEAVFTVSVDQLNNIYSIRLIPNLKIAKVKESNLFWFRGISVEEAFNADVQLVNIKTIWQLNNELLFPIGKQTPETELPELEWESIIDYLKVEPPTSAMKSAEPQLIQLSLSGHDSDETINGLQTDLQHWLEFANTCPKHRLSNLRYACSEQQKVLILGQPLPPLPGSTFWRAGKMLIPSGYRFEPTIGLMEVENMLKLNQEIAVFNANMSYEVIPLAAFEGASRSSIRRTTNQFAVDES